MHMGSFRFFFVQLFVIKPKWPSYVRYNLQGLFKRKGTSNLVGGTSCLVGEVYIWSPVIWSIPSTFDIPLCPYSTTIIISPKNARLLASTLCPEWFHPKGKPCNCWPQICKQGPSGTNHGLEVNLEDKEKRPSLLVTLSPVSHFESLCVTVSHCESVWVNLSHYESLFSHFDSLWLTLSHFESLWLTLSHLELFWVTLSHFK